MPVINLEEMKTRRPHVLAVVLAVAAVAIPWLRWPALDPVQILIPFIGGLGCGVNFERARRLWKDGRR